MIAPVCPVIAGAAPTVARPDHITCTENVCPFMASHVRDNRINRHSPYGSGLLTSGCRFPALGFDPLQKVDRIPRPGMQRSIGNEGTVGKRWNAGVLSGVRAGRDAFRPWPLSTQPATNAAFTHALYSVLRRPTILPTPVFALRAMLGEAADIVIFDQRVLPQRTQSLGYRFAYVNDFIDAVQEKYRKTLSPADAHLLLYDLATISIRLQRFRIATGWLRRTRNTMARRVLLDRSTLNSS